MKESYSINIIGTITTDLELKTTQNGKNLRRQKDMGCNRGS